MHRIVLVGLIALTLLFSACSPNARIMVQANAPISPALNAKPSRNGGPTSVSAEIVSSDANAIYVSSFGGPIAIERSSIVDISHPGVVLRWIGVGTLVLGSAVTGLGVLGVTSCDAGEGLASGLCEVGSIMLLVVGVPAMVSGGLMAFSRFSRYEASTTAAGVASWEVRPVLATRRLGHREALEAGAAFSLIW